MRAPVISAAVEDHYEVWRRCWEEALDDYKQKHGNERYPKGFRSQALNAYVNRRMELHYPSAGPIRWTTDAHGVRFLLIECDGSEDLGIRFKKFQDDGSLRTSNHDSGNQDSIRGEGFFPLGHLKPLHLICGGEFKEDTGGNIYISRISVTHETKEDVSVIASLYSSGAPTAGVVVGEDQATIFDDLSLPMPRIKLRRPEQVTHTTVETNKGNEVPADKPKLVEDGEAAGA